MMPEQIYVQFTEGIRNLRECNFPSVLLRRPAPPGEHIGKEPLSLISLFTKGHACTMSPFGGGIKGGGQTGCRFGTNYKF
jgi:hypothetical protein